MSLTTRLAIVAGALLALVGGVGGAQALDTLEGHGSGHWGCAAVNPLDLGVCVSNPLPPRLPSAPASPS